MLLYITCIVYIHTDNIRQCIYIYICRVILPVTSNAWLKYRNYFGHWSGHLSFGAAQPRGSPPICSVEQGSPSALRLEEAGPYPSSLLVTGADHVTQAQLTGCSCWSHQTMRSLVLAEGPRTRGRLAAGVHWQQLQGQCPL